MEERMGQATNTDPFETGHRYLCIDLKSFYASVECHDRGLDPLDTHLVVADISRTEKTICLAVSPSLKAYGVPGRARLFEVVQSVKEINRRRRGVLKRQGQTEFSGSSYSAAALSADPSLKLDYIAAKPQMARYMEVSAQIYRVYLKYFAPEDIHVYSIDEVFIDVTHYLNTYGCSAHELCRRMISEVWETTGITATGGVGTNLYLAKIAMDIDAKHCEPDKDGVRISELNEMSYRERLWTHRPLTDFWRVGRGYARKLEKNGLMTMGDVARCSLENPELLYQLFGINAELLVDHAWGYESALMEDIKHYEPRSNSVSSGQVLQHPYTFDKARIVVREMTEGMVLGLVEKHLMAQSLDLVVGYDITSLDDPAVRREYKGEITPDYYGRLLPKAAHAACHLPSPSSSTREITERMMALFDGAVDKALTVRRMYVTAGDLIDEKKAAKTAVPEYEQMDLFSMLSGETAEEKAKEEEKHRADAEKERRAQEAALEIQRRFGKNALLKGMSLQEGATARERNGQIGGHKA